MKKFHSLLVKLFHTSLQSEEDQTGQGWFSVSEHEEIASGLDRLSHSASGNMEDDFDSSTHATCLIL
jgi:hypothetical protein